MIRRICLAAALLVTVAGCDSVEEPPSWDEARIQPRGVDGAEFGMKASQVIELLGPPAGGGWGDGERSWKILHFNAPPGLTFFFPEVWDDSTFVLGGLDLIYVESPYEGRTSEGIGIGSALKEVEAAYGKPDWTSGKQQSPNIAYCIEGRTLYFNFDTFDTLRTIALGYDTPLPGAPLQCQ